MGDKVAGQVLVPFESLGTGSAGIGPFLEGARGNHCDARNRERQRRRNQKSVSKLKTKQAFFKEPKHLKINFIIGIPKKREKNWWI